jgi:predicted RNA-binding Zn-ribbon protein involved in translation (DUF1610 family)
MAELINRYRLNAEKCLELARTFTDFESKRALVAMAKAWSVLAARSKNIEKGYCPRCESPMRWYRADLTEDRRALEHIYQCEKCGFISRSDDQSHQVARTRRSQS